MKEISLCAPSLIYLLLSLVGMILVVARGKLNWRFFLFQLFVILLWTWVLNVICESGYPIISWILLILPLFTFVRIIR